MRKFLFVPILLLAILTGCNKPEAALVVLNNVDYGHGTTATFTANVMEDGGASVTVRGFCYSKNANPTISDITVNCGSGIGEFSTTVLALELNSTYYVRCFATNEVETTYSEQISFTTDPENFLKIGENEFPLLNGVLEDYGNGQIDLTLEYETASTYAGIYFEAFSSSLFDLADGTYTYNLTGLPSSFDKGTWEIEIASGNYNEDITAGTFTIEKQSDRRYSVVIDCTDSTGTKITGYYLGYLTMYSGKNK